MNIRSAFSALMLTALFSLPANAFLDGDTFNIRYLFPDTETVFVSSGDLTIDAEPEVLCPGGVICDLNFNNVFLNFIDLDPVADTITFDWNGGAGALIRPFNGFEIAQLDEAIAQVFVDCVRTNGGPCDPEVTFGASPELGNFLRINFGSLGTAAGVTLLTVTISPCAADVDTDADGIIDSFDNCLFAANANQIDADGDGFGNACDQDINNDGVVNFVDLGEVRAAFFSNPDSANWEPAADFNSDDIINVIDLGRLRAGFFNAPGPSCALFSQGPVAP